MTSEKKITIVKMIIETLIFTTTIINAFGILFDRPYKQIKIGFTKK